MISGHTRSIRWGLDIVEFPPLRVSNNGWYYGFDGKSVGRGSWGSGKASELVRDRRSLALSNHGYAMPDDVEPKYSTYNRGQSLNLVYDHPAFGEVRVTWEPEGRLKLFTHPLLLELAEGLPLYRNTPQDLWSDEQPDLPNHEIAADLWNAAARAFPKVFTYLGLELPTGIAYEPDTEVQNAERFTSFTDQKAFWYTLPPDQMENVAAERIRDFVDLLEALGHENISIGTTYRAGSYDPIINSVRVDAEDPIHGLPHKVTFSPGGTVHVTCGFVEDENRYLDYQKRLIAGWMTNQSDEFTEVTFD